MDSFLDAARLDFGDVRTSVARKAEKWRAGLPALRSLYESERFLTSDALIRNVESPAFNFRGLERRLRTAGAENVLEVLLLDSVPLSRHLRCDWRLDGRLRVAGAEDLERDLGPRAGRSLNEIGHPALDESVDQVMALERTVHSGGEQVRLRVKASGNPNLLVLRPWRLNGLRVGFQGGDAVQGGLWTREFNWSAGVADSVLDPLEPRGLDLEPLVDLSSLRSELQHAEAFLEGPELAAAGLVAGFAALGREEKSLVSSTPVQSANRVRVPEPPSANYRFSIASTRRLVGFRQVLSGNRLSNLNQVGAFTVGEETITIGGLDYFYYKANRAWLASVEGVVFELEFS